MYLDHYTYDTPYVYVSAKNLEKVCPWFKSIIHIMVSLYKCIILRKDTCKVICEN